MVKFESLDPEIRGLLGKKVSELGLKLEGSPVEGYVRELYKELERQADEERQARIEIALDAHLGQIFLTRKRKESRPAADIVSRYA